MNLSVISIFIDYYKAIWEDFSPQKLENILSKTCKLDNKLNNLIFSGRDEVIRIFSNNFSAFCDIGSTKNYYYRIVPEDYNTFLISYSLSQTHSNPEGEYFYGVVELVTLSNCLSQIDKIEIVCFEVIHNQK